MFPQDSPEEMLWRKVIVRHTVRTRGLWEARGGFASLGGWGSRELVNYAFDNLRADLTVGVRSEGVAWAVG